MMSATDWDSDDATWPGMPPDLEAPSSLPENMDGLLLALNRARTQLDKSRQDMDALGEVSVKSQEDVVSACRLAVIRMGHALMLTQHLGLSLRAWELGDPGRVRAEAYASLQRAHNLVQRVEAVHRHGLLIGTVLGALGALLLVSAVAGVVLVVGAGQ